MKYISIHEFAYKAERTVPAIRFLIYEGNAYGKLIAEKRGKALFLDEEQLYIFPFTQKGHCNNPAIYHYDGSKMVVCPECTEGKRCLLRDDNGHYKGAKNNEQDR